MERVGRGSREPSSALRAPGGVRYDAEGLVEPNAQTPYVSTIVEAASGLVARFDAEGLTTRQINLELRHLIDREGVSDVTVANPGSKNSLAVGILRRVSITFEGSPGWFACGLVDGPEVEIHGRVGWSLCENMMSGVVVVDGGAGSLTGAGLVGGDVVVKGDVGARTGINQLGGTLVVMGDSGIHCGVMMQHGRQVIAGNAGKGLGESMGGGTIYVGGTVASLGANCVPGEWTDADADFIDRTFRIHGLGPPPALQKFVAGASGSGAQTLSASQ